MMNKKSNIPNKRIETMKYDIKIVHFDNDYSVLEFDRLNLLTKSTKEIATKALMFRLKGISDINPDKNLKRALSMKLQAISENDDDGTLLTINCAPFSETVLDIQSALIQGDEDLQQLTPMALVIHAFKTALKDKMEDAELDKPLLRALIGFKKNFTSEKEIIYFANRGTIAEVQLTKSDFKKLEQLEESIPMPNKVIVNGHLDEMKISERRFGLQTEQGLVNVIANERDIIDNIISFMGKDVTISGMAHYKPNRQLSFIQIQEYWKPEEKDIFFSKQPTAMTAEQQLLYQAKKPKRSNSLNALKNIAGLLKEEITDVEFEKMLKDIHQ